METNTRTIKTNECEIVETRNGNEITTTFKVDLSKLKSRKDAKSLLETMGSAYKKHFAFDFNNENIFVPVENGEQKTLKEISDEIHSNLRSGISSAKRQSRVLHNYFSSLHEELRNNNEKGDWLDFTDKQGISDEIFYHRQKLDKAILDDDQPKIKEHIADISVLYMMFGNSYGFYDAPKPLSIGEMHKIKQWVADIHKVKIGWIGLGTHLRNGTHTKETQDKNLLVLFDRIGVLTGIFVEKVEYDNFKTLDDLYTYLNQQA